MDCTLMHKNIPVVELTISEYSGSIEKHGMIHDPAHLPLGTTVTSGKDKGRIVPFNLNDWWTGRSIPASRDGIRDALEVLGFQNPILLLSKCYGLSLSDQYWICPKDSGLRWETINFFQNDFSKDIGEILFGHEPENLACVSLISPDNTSDGWLRKKWIIADGKRVLMKGGSGVYQQEPFNEVIACVIMRRLNIPHVPYSLTFDKGKPYSLCENFVTPDTELIQAWRVRESTKKDNRHSRLTHLLRCCEELGIPDVYAALDKMMVLDYIIANEDRHYNNFGFIRNVETLEWMGFAPIYDSGTSLWHDTPHVGQDMGSKPFRGNHAEQIKLVSDLSWFDFNALEGLSEEIMDIFTPSDRVDEKRRVALAATVKERCQHVEKLCRGKAPSLLEDLHDKQRQIAETPRDPSGRQRETDLS
ncbi:MAG: HipA domain-containing protein [Peptococcaceae bacterium]|nr:HipA domain-containing protein [Peptococcaceae bacterium]